MHSKRRRQRTTAIAVAATIACLAAGFVLFAKPWQANNYNPVTFCPKDGQYPRTAILIDATDSLGELHIKTVQDEADNLRHRLALHEWAGVFVLNADNLIVPEPLIALCNPGNEQTANPLYQNPRQIQRDFERKFAEPLRQAIAGLETLPPQTESPIMEMIRAVALDRQFNASQKRRLIIVSDMLQNTAAYSHYGGAADYEAWRQTDYAREFLELPLSGVEVEIWYIKRDKLRHRQTRGHVSFWEKFFAAGGASVRHLKRI